jgi:hypothetical protein
MLEIVNLMQNKAIFVSHWTYCRQECSKKGSHNTLKREGTIPFNNNNSACCLFVCSSTRTTYLTINCQNNVSNTNSWIKPCIEIIYLSYLTIKKNQYCLYCYLRFSGVRVTRSLVFCVVFCRSLFVLCPFVPFPLAIVLSILLRYTYSDYPFGIFKLF